MVSKESSESVAVFFRATLVLRSIEKWTLKGNVCGLFKHWIDEKI
jgi:hypothetical protein